MDIHIKIVELLHELKDVQVSDFSRSLLLPPFRFSPGDLAIVLMKMKESYSVDLTELAEDLKVCSVNELVELFNKQLCSKMK